MSKEIEITKVEVSAAVEQDGWVKELAAKHCSGTGLSLDEVFHFNLDFICKHWHLKPHEVDYWLAKRVLKMINEV